MNKRIKELAEQSGFYYHDRTGFICPAECDPAKFAELIIQECASIAGTFSVENKRIHPDLDPRNMSDANRVVYHSTCQSVATEIKEHFGVE